jgi:hypothetical protein
MPVLRLSTGNWALPLTASDPRGAPVPIFRPQFRCFIRLPNALLPRDALIDTGAPMTCLPERTWRSLRDGVDFEWLSLPTGPNASGVMAGWQYTFRLARFLVPLALLDYTAEIERPDVIAAFAFGNPPTFAGRPALPPVYVGLWGGLLEGSRLTIGRDPAAGQVTGELEFP